MPLVHIDLMEGRPPERLERMIAEVSQAIARSLDAPIDSIRVIINEMKPHQYGVGGMSWPAVVEARRHQRDHEEAGP